MLVKASERLKEIEESQERAKEADDEGDWDAYGRYCSYQDHQWLIDRVKLLTEALVESSNVIHDEFCSIEHHPFCELYAKALKGEKE